MPGHSQRGDVPWLSIDGYSWYGTFHGGRIFNSFKISTYKNSLILWVMCLILDGRERDGFLVGPRWIQCNQRISLNYHECLSMVTCWDCRYIIYVICHSMYSHIWMCIWYMCILIIYIYLPLEIIDPSSPHLNSLRGALPAHQKNLGHRCAPKADVLAQLQCALLCILATL